VAPCSWQPPAAVVAIGSAAGLAVPLVLVNHYEVLGVPMGADPAEIRRAYLGLARKYHPDLHAGDPPRQQVESRLRMLEVNAAWAVLGDVEQRRGYDLLVHQGRAGTGAAAVGRDGRVQTDRDPSRRSWAPLADDTKWMSDFEGWRAEADALPPDPPVPGGRDPWKVLPVGVFLGSVAIGCFALVATIRPLLAMAYVGVALSAVLFFAMPLLEMTRRRRHGD